MPDIGTKRLLLLAAAAITAGLTAQLLHAATASEQEVLAPIHAMFHGMATRNPVTIEAAALPGGTMVLMHDGKTEQITWVAFAERIGKGKTHIEERIHHPMVRIDRNVAIVWAPLEFLIDGKIDHCGTDSFQLIRLDGKWLIANLTATVRKECNG